MDFFTADLLNGTKVYVLAVIEHGNRRVRVLGATEHPVQSWVVQQARTLIWNQRHLMLLRCLAWRSSRTPARLLGGTAGSPFGSRWRSAAGSSWSEASLPWQREPASAWNAEGHGNRDKSL
jgi:hypothetical protein